VIHNIEELLQQGNGWLFIPSAILLGALHGLEPGHSKTMMAAFIVAIRGTMKQAIILGLSATLSHTAVVWVVALLGMTFGEQWSAETTEPYFKLVSASLIICVALWMLWRTHRQHRGYIKLDGHAHAHVHDHKDGHKHNDEMMIYKDDHERAHAHQVQEFVATRTITTNQIIIFGLTGGLLPCPAAITVLLLCLQLKQHTLGAMLVLCFSIGLAVTLTASGAVAAWGLRHASSRFGNLNKLAARAPYISGAIILCVGIYVGWQGYASLP
jgi:ABC-type nickel/cobalt efflux system permease component RcnA